MGLIRENTLQSTVLAMLGRSLLMHKDVDVVVPVVVAEVVPDVPEDLIGVVAVGVVEAVGTVVAEATLPLPLSPPLLPPPPTRHMRWKMGSRWGRLRNRRTP